jgi:hypothetical protein
VDARHKAGHDHLLLFQWFVMAGLVPAIHAVAGIPLVACHGAFFRILLGSRPAPRRLAGRLTMRSTPTPKGCSMSRALGYKSRVVTVVDEDMADEATRRAQGDPSASARRGIIVGSPPMKTRRKPRRPRPVAHIKVGLNSYEHELAAVLAGEGDVRRFEQVEVFPLIHFDDAPPAGKGASEGGYTPGRLTSLTVSGSNPSLARDRLKGKCPKG